MQDELIQWYNQTKRDFPWRKTKDPYAIWISEIMLQQTTTEAVIAYYNRFLKQFPNVYSLANASLEEVYKLWEGLGYYRRAKHLHMSAQIIVEQYQGHFPTSYQEILSLKGIGPYTAGAICSIAYNQKVPAIDGNALRIISRYKLIKDNIALNKTQKHITQIVQELLDDHNPSDFNQALMDLGATICKPKNPLCKQCPIQKTCLAYQYNQTRVLPINIKNIKHQEEHYITGIITYKNQYLLIKNNNGLLENLYGLVQYQCVSPYTFIEKFNQEFHQDLIINQSISTIKHVFTHKTWYMHVYHFILKKPMEQLYDDKQIKALPISTAHHKALNSFKDLNQ